MPQMGPIPQGKSFFCPHCGALYAVTEARPRKIAEIEKCVVCGLLWPREMHSEHPSSGHQIAQSPHHARRTGDQGRRSEWPVRPKSV
jgi:predicted RNA-binding Zn-ribbon protein involved in translation (DUF1610 family)